MDCCGRVICRHRIEVEVVPAVVEVCFQDERYSNPLDAQVRFQAIVYNAPTARVTWKVRSLAGGPGAGTIDAAGLYLAPKKGALPFGFTEIVTATSVDDPERTAQARITVVGLGPAPKPDPRVEIYPRRVDLYYRMLAHNEYIDPSNKMQLFRATAYHAAAADLEWLVNGAVVAAGTITYLYTPLLPSGGTGHETVAVRLHDRPDIIDEAKVTILNYDWPGIVS